MTTETKKPNPVDVHVGQRVRIRRVLLGMSQTKLADQLGLTFQQLQKYESGANRISCSRIYHLSVILDVPIQWFFRGIDDKDGEAGDIISTSRETLDLCRNIALLPPDLRKNLQALARNCAAMAAQSEPQEDRAAA